MIVNQRYDGWEVIFQRAHALLAAELAGYWREEYRPSLWIPTLAAIIQHDDEEHYDWEHTTHLTVAGAPLDFTLSVAGVAVHKLRDKLAVMAQQDRWVALMISHHTSFLYEPFRGENADLDCFLDEQKTHQKQWADALGKTQHEVDRAYALVNWADQLSLILCKRQIPEGERALEIGTGADGERHKIIQCADGTLNLIPWRYTQDRFTVSLEARRLIQLSFQNEAEFKQVLDTAPVKVREWTFVKS
jgi:hypothetical protein